MVDTKSNKKVEYNVWSKRSRPKSRVQCVVETSSNKKSSAMCGRNINEQKVEYNVWSKHSRTQSVGRNIVEQKAE